MTEGVFGVPELDDNPGVLGDDASVLRVEWGVPGVDEGVLNTERGVPGVSAGGGVEGVERGVPGFDEVEPDGEDARFLPYRCSCKMNRRDSVGGPVACPLRRVAVLSIAALVRAASTNAASQSSHIRSRPSGSRLTVA